MAIGGGPALTPMGGSRDGARNMGMSKDRFKPLAVGTEYERAQPQGSVAKHATEEEATWIPDIIMGS